ncbi:hypothetical protein K490DRAFT_58801 [Saccharata proteae CBS 121410]|uniref:Uncharacterized protein n=1 Tax=Saccharata proteae CBS 121410 TaxID=1314787 RepID=A0A9P4HS33_9PEZI|nr:hypothetical protein K490DRAFT_58801 [Saccharata proteae CBS 121410]
MSDSMPSVNKILPAAIQLKSDNKTTSNGGDSDTKVANGATREAGPEVLGVENPAGENGEKKGEEEGKPSSFRPYSPIFKPGGKGEFAPRGASEAVSGVPRPSLAPGQTSSFGDIPVEMSFCGGKALLLLLFLSAGDRVCLCDHPSSIFSVPPRALDYNRQYRIEAWG